MIKKLFLGLLFCALGIFAFMNTYPLFDTKGGYYNTTFGYIVCHDKYQCLHEIAHKVNAAMGNVSQSEPYNKEVHNFIFANASIPEGVRHPFTERVVAFPGIITPLQPYNDPTSYPYWTGGWGGTIELYADMLVWSDGKVENMPSGFLKFYDWSMVERLLNEYKKYIVDD